MSAGTVGEHGALRRALRGWYEREKRDLPWRAKRDPYAVWISEAMLQQTRVHTVIPYYERFMRAFPTLASLAEAREEDVLLLWSGLGYYRRARMLCATAREVVRLHDGRLPAEAAHLRRLGGFGPYTAGAVASIAFGKSEALVDGNVSRVLSRIFLMSEDVRSARGRARIWELARSLVPPEGDGPGDWNQALMELGATICVPRNPACETCPVARHCGARARGVAAVLPKLAPRSAAPIERRTAIVLSNAKGVLLARRGKGERFGGLWEPPSSRGSVAGLASRLGADLAGLRVAGRVAHVLSHRRLRVKVLCGAIGTRRGPLEPPAAEYDAVEVVAFERLDGRPQANLTRKILGVAKLR
jgi:A/G-specific adenine glycosylase